MVKDGAHELGWSIGEGVTAEKVEDVGRIVQKAFFGAGDEHVFAPGAERGEPEVPVEAWLVRRVDARRFVEGLGLVTEEVGRPVLAVVRSLEFDFVAVAGHDREEAVAIGDAKGFEKGGGQYGNGRTTPEHDDELGGGCVEDPEEDERDEGDAEGIEDVGEIASTE